MTDNTPRIWIGSLAAYNAGDLIGDWFDAIDAPTDSREWVDAMVSRGIVTAPAWSKLPDLVAQQHEEIWVFDHEGFGAWLKGECSPATAQELAELIDSLGDDADAAGAYLSDYLGGSASDFSESDFRDHYRGEYDSESEYADEIIEDRLDHLKAMLTEHVYDQRALAGAIETIEWLNGYVGSADVARDLGFGGTTYVSSGHHTIYVFES